MTPAPPRPSPLVARPSGAPSELRGCEIGPGRYTADWVNFGPAAPAAGAAAAAAGHDSENQPTAAVDHSHPTRRCRPHLLRCGGRVRVRRVGGARRRGRLRSARAASRDCRVGLGCSSAAGRRRCSDVVIPPMAPAPNRPSCPAACRSRDPPHRRPRFPHSPRKPRDIAPRFPSAGCGQSRARAGSRACSSR